LFAAFRIEPDGAARKIPRRRNIASPHRTRILRADLLQNLKTFSNCSMLIGSCYESIKGLKHRQRRTMRRRTPCRRSSKKCKLPRLLPWYRQSYEFCP
jgi:hypothetical protein